MRKSKVEIDFSITFSQHILNSTKMQNQKEIWKDLPNYEGFYQVSNYGRVKSLKRLDAIGRRVNEKILKQSSDKGYLLVNLSKNVSQRTFHVHILVAMAFLGHIPCKFKIVVDHIDNNSLNNNLDNLQLITNRENSIKDRTGGESGYVGVYKSDKKWRSRITVNGIKKNLGVFDSKEEASEYYQNAILALKNGTEIQVKVHIPNHTSKYIGVCLEKKSKKWVAQIRINKIQKTIGRFETEIEASNAYQKQLNEIKND